MSKKSRITDETWLCSTLGQDIEIEWQNGKWKRKKKEKFQQNTKERWISNEIFTVQKSNDKLWQETGPKGNIGPNKSEFGQPLN